MRWGRRLIILLMIALQNLISNGHAKCYLNIEYQGEFLTQTSSTFDETSGYNQIQYANMTISSEGIPIWGECHRRIDDNIIFKQSLHKTTCYQCVHVKYRSVNVLHMYTVKKINTCFTMETEAIKSCPTDSHIKYREVNEIMFFREPKSTVPSLCPFSNGTYTFSFTKASGNQGLLKSCPTYKSSLSNCPDNSRFQLNFKECNFPEHSVSYSCLADWRVDRGSDHDRFLVVRTQSFKTHVISNQIPIPQFRCALFREENLGKRGYLTFSDDSSCTSNLYSASFGSETLQLNRLPEEPLPPLVPKGSCRFPEWSQGNWQNIVVQKSTVIHHDNQLLQTYTSKCIKRSIKHSNRYLVYTRSKCGEEMYNCIWFEYRGINVIEYQLGRRPSITASPYLCDNDHFLQRTWITQAKIASSMLSSCPIAGEYHGLIPDGFRLCAKLSSDCNNPDVMFYTVTHCDTPSIILETRKYQCLGQWEEDNMLYTLTERKDIPGFECFVGQTNSKGEIYLIEGGRHCQRNLKVLTFGMKLTLKSQCPGFVSPSESGPWYIPNRKYPTTKKDDMLICSLKEEDISSRPLQPMMDGKCSADQANCRLVLLVILIIAAISVTQNQI